ncbi:MAG TPA: peptidoglycan DD-metalloendopeptidase family protein [Burkholderiales bacterium]|nr:peptidoglycan DD-metalloendopeptidase family protein [Burkholderiales bacterium]
MKLRLGIALLVLPLFGIVAAFGLSPDTLVDRVPLQNVVQELALPVTAGAVATEDAQTSQTFWREERIQRGDTVAALLARLQIDDRSALEFLRHTPEARSLTQLRPGKTVQARAADDGSLLALSYLDSNGRRVTLRRDGESFRIDAQSAALERRLQMASGVIASSLFAATDAAGLPDSIAVQIADIFSTDVDFHRELRRGDRFSVVYEVFFNGGEPVRIGRVAAAEFTNQGKTYRAVYFQTADGQGGYYTFDGRNLRKAFLRSPLEYSRISSGFTQARFHPILQSWRAHRGIDYAAPTGTRVKVTADGIVEFAGRSGGYGNLVVVKHMQKYATYYGHLSGFAKGIRAGTRVHQGDVIGFVGMSGLATGPHLHYEFHVNGVQQNPLKLAIPEGPPITPQIRAAFEQATEPLAKRLALLRVTQIARTD